MLNPISICRHSVWLLILMLVPAWAAGSDVPLAHEVSPDYYQVLFENEQVLVLKMELAPGESDSFHRHHNETVYFQSGGQLTITTESGENLQVDIPDGHVMWHEAWAHQVTNTGSSAVVAIIVEDRP